VVVTEQSKIASSYFFAQLHRGGSNPSPTAIYFNHWIPLSTSIESHLYCRWFFLLYNFNFLKKGLEQVLIFDI
jgi:hypothetical protein